MPTCLVKRGHREVVCQQCNVPQMVNGKHYCQSYKRPLLVISCSIYGHPVKFVDEALACKIKNSRYERTVNS